MLFLDVESDMKLFVIFHSDHELLNKSIIHGNFLR